MPFRRWKLTALSACWVGALLVNVGWSQDPTADIDNSQKKYESAVAAILRKQELTANDQAMFDDYFNTYRLLLIKETPKSPKDATKFRSTIRYYLTLGSSINRNGPAHVRLNELTIGMMKKFVDGDFSPYVKVNAMLLIGELNEEEASNASKTPAKPLLASLGFMVKALRDPKNGDAVKLAAMVGIQRHVEASADGNTDYPLAPAARKLITNTMHEIVTQKEPPGGRSADGHAWMRRGAAQVLATFGEVGEKNKVLAALTDIITDAEAPLSLRCGVAQDLGELKYTPAANVDLATLAGQVGKLADDIGKRELNWAKEKWANEKMKDLSKRRLKAYLTSLNLAISGPPKKNGGLVAASASTPHKAAVAAVQTKLHDLLKLVDDEEFPRLPSAVKKFAKAVGYTDTIPVTEKKPADKSPDGAPEGQNKNPQDAAGGDEMTPDDEKPDAAMDKDGPGNGKKPAKKKDADSAADDEPPKKAK
jgi:hypothetical protein